MTVFARYIGIDYSGASSPTASLRGLRMYAASSGSAPTEVQPPPGRRRYWSRRGVAEWLAARLSEDIPTVVGIDHNFSFPRQYFDAHHLPHDWPAFLEDFQRHWPTDGDDVRVDDVRTGRLGNGSVRQGNSRWKRLTEIRSGSAKSTFHFDVQGSVAKSSHAGLPWLLRLHRQLRGRVHFWPFDGWRVPTGRSVVAEAYPSLFRKEFPVAGLTPDQHDAYAVAAWMKAADRDGRLATCLDPPLDASERDLAAIEGWILGVV